MWARVSTLKGSRSDLDSSMEYSRNKLLPEAKALDGFRGVYMLVNRTVGDIRLITLWDDESALRNSEERANQMRSETASAGGADILSVERFEVAFSELV